MRAFLSLIFLSVSFALHAAEPDGPKSDIPSADSIREMPRPTYAPNPSYPFQLRKQGITGSATIEFTVTAKGDVTDAKVLEATRPEFGEAAKKAALRSKFRPAKKDGKPVPCRMTLPYVFDLKK